MKRIILIATIGLSCNESQCIRVARTKIVKESFMGIVERVFFDPDNRGTPSVTLKFNPKTYATDSRELYLYLRPGDSLIKDSGTLKYVVFRDGVMNVFYPNCGDIVVTDTGEYYQPKH